MKKMIMTCCFLVAAHMAVAQDVSVQNSALAPIQDEAPAKAPTTAPVPVAAPDPVVVNPAPMQEEVMPAPAPLKKETPKKVKPKKKAVEQKSMIRKKEEIGHGSMFREKEPKKSVKDSKSKKKISLMSDRDCQALTAYQPGGDGNAEYKPDVDIHGKPVMEADVAPPVIQPPAKISFDVTVDLAKYMDLSVPTGTLGEAKMGTITVEKGQVKFNGKPLEGDAEAALRKLCADRETMPVVK